MGHVRHELLGSRQRRGRHSRQVRRRRQPGAAQAQADRMAQQQARHGREPLRVGQLHDVGGKQFRQRRAVGVWDVGLRGVPPHVAQGRRAVHGTGQSVTELRVLHSTLGAEQQRLAGCEDAVCGRFGGRHQCRAEQDLPTTTCEGGGEATATEGACVTIRTNPTSESKAVAAAADDDDVPMVQRHCRSESAAATTASSGGSSPELTTRAAACSTALANAPRAYAAKYLPTRARCAKTVSSRWQCNPTNDMNDGSLRVGEAAPQQHE